MPVGRVMGEAPVACCHHRTDQSYPLDAVEYVVRESIDLLSRRRGLSNSGELSDVEWRAELRTQADILRDIFGNPFGPAVIDLIARRVPSVMTLAESVYNEQAFHCMPLLGDALEAAGCDNPEILDHCRSHMGHFRGCWLVDAILGKS